MLVAAIGRRPSSLVAAADAQPAMTAITLHYVEDYFGTARAQTLMEEAGLRQGDTEWPLTVTKVDFWNICVESILRYNDEAHGSVRQPLPKSTFGTIYSAVNQMDTVGEGFRRFIELIPIVPADIIASIGYGRDTIHLHFAFDEKIPVTTRMERYLESTVLVFHCVLLWIAAEPIAPVHVRLSEALDDADGSLLSGLSPSRSRRGTGITLTYERRVLSVPLGARKYKVWAAHETTTFLQIVARVDHHEAPGPSGLVRALRELLAGRAVEQAEAALALGLSTATLRRRLSEAGTTFRDISKDVRREKLIALLAGGDGLDDVAEQLGFSDRRSLWRTCYDWLGMSPSAWRKTRTHPERTD